jgi:haloacetate dehalogenase
MTTQSKSEQIAHSEQIETDVSRRGLVQALAAGAAAASIATPASAQQTSAQQTSAPQGAVLAEAISADYTRDPTRWGSAEVAALFPGFKHVDMRTKGAIIRLRHGGSGPPLLLLHGNPNNHVLWYAVAAKLSQRYHVVLADLRGYGDSSLPDPGPNLINYSFRVMAEDMIEVMANLGHQRFFLGGHDRGARVSHRMCLDHPERVIKMCLLDMLPNYHVWTSANKNWAMNSWHWLFMAQPEPFPETLMSAVPAEWFLKSRGGNRNPPKVVSDEYIRCYTKKTIIALAPASTSRWTRPTRIARSRRRFWFCGEPAGSRRPRSFRPSGASSRRTSSMPSRCRPATICRRRRRIRSTIIS